MAFTMELNARNMDLRKLLLCWILLLSVLNKEVRGQDCLFQNDLCDWSNQGDIEWVQTSVSSETGTGHCAEVPITDTTPSGPHEAILTSMTQPHVMSMLGFFYRLVAPNTLTVIAELDGAPVQIWSRNGTDAGDSWIEVDVPVPQSNHFKISFHAGIPENSTSFVGLTNITLRVGEDECASTPCQNGGVCIDGNSSFTCVCNGGFKGEMCQIDTNAPPKTTTLPTITTKGSIVSPTKLQTPPKPTLSQKTTASKTPPSSDRTIKYGTISTPSKLPQTGDHKTGIEEPVMIAVIAVSSVVTIAILLTVVWLLLYCKKRSWRPRYHERGLSMESVSTAESIHGKWTSTVDLPGSIPELKMGLAPVEENSCPKKVENIYVTSPTIGIVNTGYNINHMY